MDTSVILLGLGIFVAEVIVLTIGTVRTMMTVQGEQKMAFLLGSTEMLIWLMCTSTVLVKVGAEPILGVCYALGFAVGNVVGIAAEKRLALGNVVVRFISQHMGREIARSVRNAGFGVTTVAGEGAEGPVSVQFVVCRRKDMKYVTAIATNVDDNVFYTWETAGANRLHGPARESGVKRFFRRGQPLIPAA